MGMKLSRTAGRVAAVLAGVVCIATGAALAFLPAGPIVLGASLVYFGMRGGV